MPELDIEVVFAASGRQSLLSLRVAEGSTVADAIRLSAVRELYPDARFDELSLGVWGRVVDATRVVKAGDRIEIYRPLEMDPREARRQLALAGRTMSDAGRD